jgi:hypothetical protein
MARVRLMVSRGVVSPKAASRVGASGVTPRTWNNPTDPVEAAAAPRALSLELILRRAPQTVEGRYRGPGGAAEPSAENRVGNVLLEK